MWKAGKGETVADPAIENLRAVVKAEKDAKGLPALKVALACSYNALKKFALGDNDIGADLFIRACKHLGLDTKTGELENRPQHGKKSDWVQIVGTVSAGNGTTPLEAVSVNEDSTEGVTIPRDLYAAALRHGRRWVRAVHLSGDSMEKEYHSGDLLIIEELRGREDVRDRDHVIWDRGQGNYVFRIWAAAVEALEAINRDCFSPIRPTDDTTPYGRVVAVWRLRE